MLHNEAHLHSSDATVQAIRQLKIDTPPPFTHTHTHKHTCVRTHTPLIQSNVPALDYHMFRLLKMLCVDKFASDFEGRNAHMALITTKFFPRMWNQKACELLCSALCIETRDDYVEK